MGLTWPPPDPSTHKEGCAVFEADGSASLGELQLQAIDEQDVFVNDGSAWAWVLANPRLPTNVEILRTLCLYAPEELCRMVWTTATNQPLPDWEMHQAFLNFYGDGS